MDNGSERWGFRGEEKRNEQSKVSVRGTLVMLMESLNKDDPRPTVPLGNGDPSVFPGFRTTSVAEDAIVEAIRSAKYNSYAPLEGILPARRAVAEYLSRDLPYTLSPNDVYLTVGCLQAIEITLKALALPGVNVLVPRPCFPFYYSHAASINLEVRHFDLDPENGWEVDLKSVKALADENTVAMVIVNPGNPAGSVYSYEHLKQVAETARELGILVVADEVYHHLAFGRNPFVPMGAFGTTLPVITLGSISKRWVVPGWRLGWLVTSDPNGILRKSGVVQRIEDCLNVTSGPATFVQGAVPYIIRKTGEDFFSKIIDILKEAADICYERFKQIPGITCPNKPEGSMFVMVKLNLSFFEDINDDMEFCVKMAKEESVIILPVVYGSFSTPVEILGIRLTEQDKGEERKTRVVFEYVALATDPSMLPPY